MKLVELISLLVIICLSQVACQNHRAANERAVERLREQLVSEDFDKVYDQASWITREQLQRDEFIRRLSVATAKLKSIDPELRWTRNKWAYDRAVVRDDNFSALDLERDNRKITVSLDWASNFELCGMSLIYHVNDSGERIFRNCY